MFKSSTYLNGNDEEIELPPFFVEPEIVFYSNSKALCIQGHPEWMNLEHPTVKMTLDLIANKLFNNKPIVNLEETYEDNEEVFYSDNEEDDEENDEFFEEV